MEDAYEDGPRDGPSFNWPQKQSEQLHIYDHPDDVKPEDVVTTVKNLINTFLTNNTEETNLTSVPEVNVDEMISDNNTMITVQVQETTNSSILTDMFQSNQTLLNTNNTILTEMTESNNTVLTATGDGDNVSLGSTIATQTMNTVETTTEKIATTISNFFTSTNNYDEDGDITTYDKHGSESEDMTLYIVLGVILGCLLLVLIILIIIYRRYKALNNSRSGVYCVTNLHEVSTSSGTHKETAHC